ncbi:N-ethylammeline chlorohydrolase [Streptococcus pneumoniae]|nr:N-ethylammeline chlorohydrolase [Streptococcus pneumoniae]AOG56342.1 Substrate-specific component BioY of biotin ECF transporter [Streptococcus pneumoniae]AOG58495.1 Substrate-specific component BioY of biotin ECF transporter [Streptococcus pneumoniae]
MSSIRLNLPYYNIYFLNKPFLYSMKIKEQTRKLAAGCSKHCFEVADRADVV